MRFHLKEKRFDVSRQGPSRHKPDADTHHHEQRGARQHHAQDLPGLAQVSRIFRALLGAQTSALQDVFTSKAEGKLEAWQLTLQPKPSPVGQFMRQITLEGGRYVECIRIEEGNGDVTTISFRNSTEAAMPSAEELARLDSR